ncbi:MAG: alpha/beta hydrolase [Bacteroidaceae bacterium]|nr:alpha/beta hydrolase [Bacteroidaceae bacterium]
MYRFLIKVFLFLGFWPLAVFPQINIWSGTETRKNVELTPYLVSDSGAKAVIVCPGGSYFWHDIETEGHGVARWLQSEGIAAFVLNYRTAYVPAYVSRFRLLFRGNRYPDPQDDLRQALRYVRQHADVFRIDPEKVGAMGFSAGGHLVMSVVELFGQEDWPAFVVPVYPVVTMSADCVHKRSRRGLLGDSRVKNRDLRDLLSLEKHVRSGFPPVFLINCKDDPVVDYCNSVLLDAALTAAAVPHKYFLYDTGGHGFGASDEKGTKESRQWKKEFLAWLDELYK